MNMARTLYTALLALVILLFYGGFIVLWLTDQHDFSRDWANLWGVDLGMLNTPSRQSVPFFDLYGTLSWRDCHLQGVDVMATNPCDPLGRPSNYSPLWYLLPTGGRDNYMLLGLLLGVCFLALLPLVLRPASWVEFLVSALAAISSVTLLAVDRANIDLLLFLMALVALWLWRSGRGWPAYGVICAAALLKFYPVALLGLAAREPVRRFAAVAAASLLVAIAFVAGFWNELVRLPALMPNVLVFAGNFGARLLGRGIAASVGSDVVVVPLVTIVMAGFCLWDALRAATYLQAVLEENFWGSREGACMLGGALVTVASFFLMANISYRAIFLLMTLPGLFVLWRKGGGASRLAGGAMVVLLFCLNSEIPRRLVVWPHDAIFMAEHPEYIWDDVFMAAFFVMDEMAWWSLVALLCGFVLAFLRQAPVFARFRKALRRPGSAGWATAQPG